MPKVYCQQWEESERGWGVRPDGYSLHLTPEDAKAYIEAYWKEQPKEVPDEYERPCGTPYLTEVDRKTHNAIKRSANGIRCYDRNTPERVVA